MNIKNAAPDTVIQALAHKCDMTPIEAMNTWDVIQEAMGRPTTHRIVEDEIAKQTQAIKDTAIEAANGVDIRAGAAVAEALSD